MRMKQSPVKQLIIAVGGNNQQVLWLASEALGGRGKEAAEAVPALTRLLDHQEISVRLAAVGALGYIGSPASDALAALRKLAGSDPSPAIKERAAKSIELIAADITKPTN
jgi:HEAT repeat protein